MPDTARSTATHPVLSESDVSRRVMLLAELQAALAALGIHSVLVRNRRLVLRSAGNGLEPSDPTDPQLKIFTSDGTQTATTDGTRYQLATGPAYPADAPRAAAASLRDRLHAPASHPPDPHA